MSPASTSNRTMGLGYTKAEREALLAEPRYGVLSVSREKRGPIAVPVWHRWDAPTGELRLTSGIKTRKGQAMLAAGRASFTVLNDSAGYVMLEGPVTYDEEYDYELELVGTGKRYQGDEVGERYVRENYFNGDKPWPGIVLWRIKAENWYSYDPSKSS